MKTVKARIPTTPISLRKKTYPSKILPTVRKIRQPANLKRLRRENTRLLICDFTTRSNLYKPTINLHRMRSHSSSRNIVSLSQLQNAERQRIYDQHIKKMHEIDGQRLSVKKIKDEQNRIAEVLRKSKEVSKSFKQLEQQNKRKQEDRKMVGTLIDIQLKPRIRT